VYPNRRPLKTKLLSELVLEVPLIRKVKRGCDIGEEHERRRCDPRLRAIQDPYAPAPGTGGRVLRRQDGTQAMWDFRQPAGTPGDLDNDGAADIEGTYTLWVRRPMVGDRDYGDPAAGTENDRLILTAEGTAPGAQGAGAGRPTSLRRLEMSLRLPTAGVEGSDYDDSTNPSDASSPGDSYGGSGGGGLTTVQ